MSITGSDYSKILWRAYHKFMLPLGGKQVPSQYRVNLPYQSDRRKYGKSTPARLVKDSQQIAQQGVNLNRMSVEEIRKFMRKNQLGIDCSGFVYHLLNSLLKRVKSTTMKKIGYPRVTSTNVKMLMSPKLTKVVKKASQIRPGDIICFNRGAADLAHILIVLEVQPDKIIYAHSSDSTKISGVQLGEIKIVDPQGELKNQIWQHNLKRPGTLGDYLRPKMGDGIRRLKALT